MFFFRSRQSFFFEHELLISEMTAADTIFLVGFFSSKNATLELQNKKLKV